MTTPADVRRYLNNWQAEVDSAAQYRAMAESSPSAAEAKVYESLAIIEEKHATFWEERLRAAGKSAGPRRPSWRARVLIWCARRWGAASILPTVASHEIVSRNDYLSQRETSKTAMTGEERMHARVLETMLAKTSGVEGSTLGIYEAKGLTSEEARDLSTKLLADPKNALEVLAREELGIDPSDLGGSRWAAAGSSMLLCAMGAVIPVVPFLLFKGTLAIVTSIGAGGAALFGIGTTISIFTGRSAAFSGGRQLLLGLLAAGFTFAVGRLIGVAIAG